MKVVPDWHRCWRWNSIHAMGSAGVIITSWEALPETMKADFPVKWVITLAVIILALGILGRLRDQSPPEKPQ